MRRLAFIPLLALVISSCEDTTEPKGEVVRAPPEASSAEASSIGDLRVVLNYKTGTIDVDFSKLSEPELTASTIGPEGGFPLVVVTTGKTPPVDAPVVNSFEDALQLVRAGGTIMARRGTHVVDGILIDKPVTIKGLPGALIEHGGSYDFTFMVRGVESGTVTFESLSFNSPSVFATIDARSEYDQVVVKDCSFELGSSVCAVSGRVSSVPGAKVTLQDSRIHGGLVGPFASGKVEFDVLRNTLSDHTFGAIQLQMGAIGRIEGNVIDGCGPTLCIVANQTTHVEILGNRVTSGETGTAISVSKWRANPGGDFHIVGNELIGIDGGSGAYAFTVGIAVHGWSGEAFAGTVSDNVVSNAEIGIRYTESNIVMQGSGNVLNNVGTGFVSSNIQTAIIRSSDIRDYLVPMNGYDDVSQINSSDLTCNWWGAATGPQNVPAGVNPTVYTPWATAPVAGTSTTECSGGL